MQVTSLDDFQSQLENYLSQYNRPGEQHQKLNMADPSKANPTTLASKFYFLEATVMRRSTIDLKKDSPISDARIEEIVKYAMLHTPSPFHAQSGRLVILRHRDHEKIWDMAYEFASKTYPPALFHSRISPNKASYGTVRRLAAVYHILIRRY